MWLYPSESLVGRCHPIVQIATLLHHGFIKRIFWSWTTGSQPFSHCHCVLHIIGSSLSPTPPNKKKNQIVHFLSPLLSVSISSFPLSNSQVKRTMIVWGLSPTLTLTSSSCVSLSTVVIAWKTSRQNGYRKSSTSAQMYLFCWLLQRLIWGVIQRLDSSLHERRRQSSVRMKARAWLTRSRRGLTLSVQPRHGKECVLCLITQRLLHYRRNVAEKAATFCRIHVKFVHFFPLLSSLQLVFMDNFLICSESIKILCVHVLCIWIDDLQSRHLLLVMLFIQCMCFVRDCMCVCTLVSMILCLYAIQGTPFQFLGYEIINI